MGRYHLLQSATLAVAMLSAPVEAAITDIKLKGVGRVDYYQINYPEFSEFFVGPPVGTKVFIDFQAHLGDSNPNSPAPAPRNKFTGTFLFKEEFIEAGYQSFSWNVAGGKSSADTDREWFYAQGRMNFVNGRLNTFLMDLGDDPVNNSLTESTWRFHLFDNDIVWGGTWSVVPEPATWTTLITGFGLAGAMLRLRRRRYAV